MSPQRRANTATLIFGSNDPDDRATPCRFWTGCREHILFVPSEYPTIAAAIDSAYQQDTIEVAGTYSGGLSLLDKNLVFRGGGDHWRDYVAGKRNRTGVDHRWWSECRNPNF